jgi:hypothetical protein
MIDIDTFLTILYVMVDDFCKSHLPVERRPGPPASLSRSEVVTLGIFSQWSRFRSQRDFYRYAERHLRSAFPTLPNRSQFNRLLRQYREAIVAFFLYLIQELRARYCAYEVLDTSAVPVRDAKRRGSGWLAGYVDIGLSKRLGWYEGFRLLVAINPQGVITGFGFGPASTKDQPLAETFLNLRAHPDPRLLSVGAPALGPYVTDKGFEGMDDHGQWLLPAGVSIIHAPRRNSRRPWPKKLRRWLAGIRQIIETVYDKLLNMFRLCCERPHALDGFWASLAAKIALHNFCIWLNEQYGQPRLAFANLIDW